MNVRCLAAWSLAALIVPLVSSNPVYRVAAALVSLDVAIWLGRSGRRVRPLLLGLLLATVTAVVLNLLLSHGGDHALVRIPAGVPVVGGPITLEAGIYGAVVGIGIAACVLAVLPLTWATDAHELVDALPAVLHRTATATAAAINLVPGVARSAAAIRDAQRMRGWRPRGPRSWAELLVPVTVTAMEDSLQLAEAMEARGYGSGRRTSYAARRMTRGDAAVLLAALAALVLVVTARAAGHDDDWFPTPSPTVPPVDWLPLAACALLTAPLLAWPRRA